MELNSKGKYSKMKILGLKFKKEEAKFEADAALALPALAVVGCGELDLGDVLKVVTDQEQGEAALLQHRDGATVVGHGGVCRLQKHRVKFEDSTGLGIRSLSFLSCNTVFIVLCNGERY